MHVCARVYVCLHVRVCMCVPCGGRGGWCLTALPLQVRWAMRWGNGVGRVKPQERGRRWVRGPGTSWPPSVSGCEGTARLVAGRAAAQPRGAGAHGPAGAEEAVGTAGGAWGLPGAGESRSALPLRVAAAHRDVLGRRRHRFLREELTLAWSPVAVGPRGAAWLWDVDGGGNDVLPWNHTPFPKAALLSAPGSGLSAAVLSALVLPDLTRWGWRPWAPVWFSNLFAHCGDRLRPLHDREEVSVPP